MRRALLITLLVALALPAAALAKTVGNGTLTVKSPHKVKNDWVGSAGLKAASDEVLQLQVCIQSNGHTVKASCTTKKVQHGKVLALATRPASASGPRTWAWAYVAGHTGTAVS
jgi:hypothetical protein